MTPRFAARRLVMSAYLYYRRASPVLPDWEYDRLSDVAAAGWGELPPVLRWQLESPEAITTTGYHVKVTLLGEAAAEAWHLAVLKRRPEGTRVAPEDWRIHPEFGRWVTADP